MTFSWRLVQCSIRTILKPTKDKNSICNQLVTKSILEIIERFKIMFTANVKLYHATNFSLWFILGVCYLLFLHGNQLFLVMLIDQMSFCTVFNSLFPKFGNSQPASHHFSWPFAVNVTLNLSNSGAFCPNFKNFDNLQPEKKAEISRHQCSLHQEMTSEEGAQKFQTGDVSLPWFRQCFSTIG